jgi:hypothetical protein
VPYSRSFPGSCLGTHYPEAPASFALPIAAKLLGPPPYNSPMTAHRSPRTFSLATLLLAITLISLLCGLAVNFPQESFDFVLTASLLVPTLVVILLLGVSCQRRTVSTLALFGAILGALIGPAVSYSGPPMNWWQHYKLVFIPATIPPALGALRFGGTALIIDILQAHQTQDHEPKA